MILIRYGEIGIKSKKVRNRFEKILIKNIEDVFLINNLDCIVERQWGRIFIHTNNAEKGIGLLKRTFGIVSVSEIIETTAEIEDICKTAAEFSKELIRRGQSFAIRCRRTGTHRYTSQEAAKKTGDAVYLANEHKGISVDLTNPDVEIFVEIRNDKAYLFSEKIRCAGGMPTGSQGRIIAEISDMNSVAAVWLLMKRGCKAIPVFFENNKLHTPKGVCVLRNSAEFRTFVHNSQDANCVDPVQIRKSKKEGVRSIELLKAWDHSIKLHTISDEKTLAEAEADKYAVLTKIGKDLDAEAISSSDTMEDIASTKTTELPIFYPLIGFDERDVEEIKRRIVAS